MYRGKKYKQLQQVLKQFGVYVEISCKDVNFECLTESEVLGAAYVVEGSALSGMLLARNLQKGEGRAS